MRKWDYIYIIRWFSFILCKFYLGLYVSETLALCKFLHTSFRLKNSSVLFQKCRSLFYLKPNIFCNVGRVYRKYTNTCGVKLVFIRSTMNYVLLVHLCVIIDINIIFINWSKAINYNKDQIICSPLKYMYISLVTIHTV